MGVSPGTWIIQLDVHVYAGVEARVWFIIYGIRDEKCDVGRYHGSKYSGSQQ